MESSPANSSPLWEGTHLSKDALVRWRNHTLSPAQVVAASEHLAVCEQCRDQLAAPTALLLLAQALDNGGDELALVREPELQHLNFEQMEAFVDELLTPAGRRNVERHLALCDVCSAQVADLRAVQSDLRDWQTSSQILSEPVVAAPVVAASTAANGTTPHPIVSSGSNGASTVPPMRVALPSTKEERSRSSWWDILRNVQSYLLPLETAAFAAIAVLLLFRPFQEQMTPTAIQKARADLDAALNRSQKQSKQSDAQIQQLRASMASLSKQSATTQQKVQQLAKDKAALSTQFADTQSRLSAAQSKLEEAQSKLSALEEQRRRDREDAQDRPSPRPTSVAPGSPSVPANPAPVSKPSVRILPDGPNASILLPQDGPAVRVTNARPLSGDALRALSQGLQVPASVNALQGTAPSSRAAETQLHFSLLYPVQTRVREVSPVLRWEAVRGANIYRVTLYDETSSQDSPPPSDPLPQPQWQPEEPLIRGHRYSWKVEAQKEDPSTGRRTRVGDAPRKPDKVARFEILTQAQEDALRAQLEAVKDSPLQKSVVLARAGVMEEARQQLSLVTGSKASRSTKSP